ncbi:MAG: hypothetical protein GF311_01345 [Candidatus Lokiarchaeota archaeon]|nr:hypothetical protein [Candidatus Lokiarchaeota archaeon]
MDKLIYQSNDIRDAIQFLHDIKCYSMEIITSTYGEPMGIERDVQERILEG